MRRVGQRTLALLARDNAHGQPPAPARLLIAACTRRPRGVPSPLVAPWCAAQHMLHHPAIGSAWCPLHHARGPSASPAQHGPQPGSFGSTASPGVVAGCLAAATLHATPQPASCCLSLMKALLERLLGSCTRCARGCMHVSRPAGPPCVYAEASMRVDVRCKCCGRGGCAGGVNCPHHDAAVRPRGWRLLLHAQDFCMGAADRHLQETLGHCIARHASLGRSQRSGGRRARATPGDTSGEPNRLAGSKGEISQCLHGQKPT